jgi:predicted CxxxxCH...CXXCH cytochrome family protein
MRRLLPLLVLAGCLPTTSTPPSCTSCHGSDGSAAPPRALGGGSDPTSLAVGAHQAHLDGAYPAVPVVCEDCHTVPAGVGDVGHIDTPWPAEVVWNGRLGDGGTWDRATGTCSNVYCHASSAPVWTDVDDDPESCDACHGFPPAPPHATGEDCAQCHGAFAAERHIDGELNLDVTEDCTACHGAGDDPAPPPDLSGSSDPASTGVGAHQAHLGGDYTAVPVVCEDCHVVPATTGATGHLDSSLPAEIVWNGRLGAGGVWNSEAGTCSNVYCHGSTLSGGEATTPSWTDVDEADEPCDACHGAPPPAPHTADTDCAQCHGPLSTATHIDGDLDFAATEDCTACHGSGEDPAPPLDLGGSSDPSSLGVGAHQAHLNVTGAAPVICADCHRVPTATADVGHLDTAAPAEIVWNGRLGAGGTWDRATGSCSNVYCHGSTLSGGTETTPEWTGGAPEAACGTCHGLPPGSGHPNRTDCDTCHGAVAGPGQTIANPALHIDGDVQFN